MSTLYHLYDEKNQFKKRVWASDYEDAVDYLKPIDSDKLFLVEKDSFEIPCGKTWEEFR